MTTPNTKPLFSLLNLYIIICILCLIYILINVQNSGPANEQQTLSLINEKQDVVTDNEVEKAFPSSPAVEISLPPQKQYYTFLVFVITAPDHFEYRNLIREKSWAGYTWTDSNGVPITNWKYFFVAGKTNNVELSGKMKAEIEEYKDMIIADEEDTYHNLVLKVLWLLQFSVDNYNYGFLIKTDDDAFLNIKLLDQYFTGLLEGNNAQLFFGGALTRNQPVLRRGRYGVSTDQWAKSTYAPYCSGGGYFLSFDTVQTLLRAHATGKQPLFHVEDAFMGALANLAGNIFPQHIKGVYWHQKYGCKDKKALLMHYVKGDQMVDFMEKYKNDLPYC